MAHIRIYDNGKNGSYIVYYDKEILEYSLVFLSDGNDYCYGQSIYVPGPDYGSSCHKNINIEELGKIVINYLCDKEINDIDVNFKIIKEFT